MNPLSDQVEFKPYDLQTKISFEKINDEKENYTSKFYFIIFIFEKFRYKIFYITIFKEKYRNEDILTCYEKFYNEAKYELNQKNPFENMIRNTTFTDSSHHSARQMRKMEKDASDEDESMSLHSMHSSEDEHESNFQINGNEENYPDVTKNVDEIEELTQENDDEFFIHEFENDKSKYCAEETFNKMNNYEDDFKKLDRILSHNQLGYDMSYICSIL